jgi:hypothetical protein
VTPPRRDTAAAAGWLELRKGHWEAARAAFEAELGRERTPGALEGLSWAAWWLDDADAVFATREAAFALYRHAGLPADAARMATWLAVDHMDFHGAAAVANGWLRRARRLLEHHPPCPDHGWLAFHEGARRTRCAAASHPVRDRDSRFWRGRARPPGLRSQL